MTRQTAQPLQKTQFNTTNRAARELARLVMEGAMTLDAPYQRGEVWSEDQMIALVRSWVCGLPIPSVISNNRMTGGWRDANPTDDINICYACVDGKQRLTAAVAWFSGDLAVPASWFDPEDVDSVEDTDDGPYVRYTGLTVPAQRHIAFTWLLPLAEAFVTTVQEEAEIYLLVNGGGTPQTNEDMQRAARIRAGKE